MGIEQDKIEILFLHPAYIRKGIGKKLIKKAMEEYGSVNVDVNEQNRKAIDFYIHAGFEVFNRTDFDEQGNPFPILKMKFLDNK